MLMRLPTTAPQSPRRVRQLWHDSSRNPPALGCGVCPEKRLCGGACVGVPYFNCLTYCCGKPGACGSVCRANGEFARRVWEVGGFDLQNVPRGPRLEAPDLPGVIPIIYHSSRRADVVAPGFAALRLCAMFSLRTGFPRIGSAADLRATFRLSPETQVILTGIGEDGPIERWWGLGAKARTQVIGAMRTAGVALVTTPNYSLTVNAPRWGDLHAMKRIGLVHAEFLGEGMPAALHVNGRTDKDFLRWTEYIAARNEVTHVAYEFTTGSRWAGRRRQHAAWLCGLAREAGRPLHLVVRGGIEVLDQLAAAFARTTVLETDSFMWTMKRREAVVRGNSNIRRRPAPTERGAPLDDLLAANVLANRAFIENRLTASPSTGMSGKV